MSAWEVHVIMFFKEAISLRIVELCKKHNNISPNRLAELSAVPSTTLNDILNNKVNNPSSLVLYKISKTLNISLKDFFDSELFDQSFDD